MRACYLALGLVVGGCQLSGQQEQADRIEIRQSEWEESLDISVSSDGNGSFERTVLGSQPINGVFRISPRDFRSLVARLSRFRNEAVPRTDASIQEMGNMRCPEGIPYVTDNGAIYVRWVGESFDRHNLARLGCDRERNAHRNAKLLEVVRSLPVPAS